VKCRPQDRRSAAFTVAELLLVFAIVVIVTILAFLAKPGGCRLKEKGSRVKCTSCLKQLALAYNLWAEEHQGRFPMELSESEGGTREAALAGKLLPNLLIISNELRTPALLICPSDKKRKPATTFASLTTVNVSYFLNAHVALTNQNHIVAGDRNLALAGWPVTSGLLEITNSNALSWTKGSHDYAGNVALVDGSAHQVTSKGLRDLLLLGGATNRLIIP